MATDFTLLLRRFHKGDQAALDALAQMVYPELKALARRRSNGNDMSATTLVHETFLKFLSAGQVEPTDRQQFIGLAATIMRQVIIDDVRRAATNKRRGVQVPLEDELLPDDSKVKAEFLLSIDRALTEMMQVDARLVRVFECRYFGGYSTRETALALDLSERSTERLWQQARQFIAERVG